MGTSPGLGGTETHFVTLARALADTGDAVAAVVKRHSAMDHWLGGGAVHVEHGTFRNAGDPRGVLAVGRARPEGDIEGGEDDDANDGAKVHVGPQSNGRAARADAQLCHAADFVSFTRAAGRDRLAAPSPPPCARSRGIAGARSR